MPEFEVELSKIIYANVIVEAKNEDEAANSALWEAEDNLTGDDGWNVDDVSQLGPECGVAHSKNSDPRDGTVEEDEDERHTGAVEEDQ